MIAPAPNSDVSSLRDELISGLSLPELEALAEGLLAPSQQNRLDDLLRRNQDGDLSATETIELNRLLDRVDQLTLLKARARLTLAKLQTGVSAS